MNQRPEMVVRELGEPPCDPVVAYGRLAAYAPGRASFLLESLSPTTPEGRNSVVGYRARQLELLPPGVDAWAALFEGASTAPTPASLAQALADASVGFVSSSCANRRLGVQLFDDEGPAAIMQRGATVLLFDHHEGQLTIAGPAKGKAVDRCIWELSHGSDPPALTPREAPDALDGLTALPPDEQLAARAARALPLLGGELDALVLTQTYAAPRRGATALDLYRLLRSDDAAAHGYLVDCGQAPGAPTIQLVGTSDVPLLWRQVGTRASDAAAAPEGAGGGPGDSLPHPRTCGEPVALASKMIRRVEEGSRQSFGGAVGFVCQAGTGAFALIDRAVTMQADTLWCTVGARLTPGCDPSQLPAAARAAAASMLAAVAAAQQGPANR